MSIDLKQLLPTFIEESLENVEEMEEALLKLDVADINIEAINQIFRSVHTIKGNSTIFKFSAINELAKTLENLLDSIRKKTITVEQQHLDLLLKSSDRLRNMLLAIKEKGALEKTDTHKTNVIPAITSIRVSTEKIESLMNTAEELVITESILKQITKELGSRAFRKLSDHLEDLEQHSRRLQEVILRMRMIPIAFAINRFPRMVKELAEQEGKEIEFKISGEQTEIDKTMVEKITDPLMHLIRNAIDHGIEKPAEREKNKKNRMGVIELNSYQSGNNIIIDIKDNGIGLDAKKIKEVAIKKGILSEEKILTETECYQLIFQPGFSTADTITDISGRGVGLDVVMKNIHELGGTVEVISIKDVGATFRLKLPLTLAIMDCQLIKVGTGFYAIPLSMIIEMCPLVNNQITISEDQSEHYTLREETFRLIHLDGLLFSKKEKPEATQKFLIKIKSDETTVGFSCDEILFQQQIVIKSLEENYNKIPGILGATVLGDGELALILDIKELIKLTLDYISVMPVQALNEEIKEKNKTERSAKYLCFLIEDKEYAFNMKNVKEVCVWQKYATLPFSASYVQGIINLRGKIIPVVDPRILFEISRRAYNMNTVIIVLQINHKEKNMHVGIVVDSVTETCEIHFDEIELQPEIENLNIQSRVQGVINSKKKDILLLKADSFLSFPEPKWSLA